ncbi:hypothetical protein JCM16358_06230 [Halanaerocella petrolearia]
MGKKLILLSLITLLLLTTGCIQQNTKLNIKKDGTADLKFTLQADKAMGGDEVKIFLWSILNNFPELRNNYTLTKTEKTIDYSSYLFYTFKNKKPIDINNNENIKFYKREGIYRFKLTIPSLIDNVTENSKDTLIYSFKVTLPKEIDMANSRQTNGNTVIWKIYKKDLVKGTTLKAFTK